jgi:hypothetical protein
LSVVLGKTTKLIEAKTLETYRSSTYRSSFDFITKLIEEQS